MALNNAMYANAASESRGLAEGWSGGGQSRNRTVRDIVAARDLAHRLAVEVAATDRLALLVFGQFRFAAELDAACLRALAALASACPDQIALKLGKAAEHGQHETAVRRGG